MTYALLVHEGAFCAEAVVHPAYELNVPVVAVCGKAELPPIATVSAPNIIAEAVKPAEDDSDAFVLRLYECEGSKTVTDVSFASPVQKAEGTNLLEDVREALPLDDNTLHLSFRPFEIKTIKVSR